MASPCAPEFTGAASVPPAIKVALLNECRQRQQTKANTARQAMDDAQASANGHSGAMEDKFESFRESCQIQRDLFARQLDDALTGLEVLRRLGESAARTGPQAPPPSVVGLGTLVETDRDGRFFLSISLGPLPDPTGGAPWLAVSTSSPIGQVLVGRRVGDHFLFRGEAHAITAVK